MQFEGSGYSTEWELRLPLDEGPESRRPLADVLISFDMNARVASRPDPVPIFESGALSFAAGVWDPQGLRDLRDAGKSQASLTFDPGRLQLPASAAGTKVANIAFVVVGQTNGNYGLDVTAQKSGEHTSGPVKKGIAVSNGGELKNGPQELPLNKLIGAELTQPFAVRFDKKSWAEELASAHDLVCWIEYA
jgi:hypothetical protein